MKTIVLTLLAFFALNFPNLIAQESNPVFSKKSVKVGFGYGMNEGKYEDGVGLLYSIGWNKSLGAKQRFRLNPNLLLGGFSADFITDIRDQYYRMSSYGLNLHFDLIRVRPFSIVISTGAFVNYTRGLLGTGGDDEGTHFKSSSYFYRLCAGGYASAALRFDSPKHRIAWEFRPLSVQHGYPYFIMGFVQLSADIKLNNRNN
ncbi:MAG: hypothetical protein JXR34_08180 [Bacteroidales bacterium]|nr:hypothetical protein [Bacteroidales bacterium]